MQQRMLINPSFNRCDTGVAEGMPALELPFDGVRVSIAFPKRILQGTHPLTVGRSDQVLQLIAGTCTRRHTQLWLVSVHIGE